MNVIARILFSYTESGNRCGPPLLEPRASTGGNQPNGTVNCGGGCHPSAPLGLKTPVRRWLWIVACAGVGRGRVCRATNLSPRNLGTCLQSKPARKPASLQPSPASNTLHRQTRPGLVDEVTGRRRGRGDKVSTRPPVSSPPSWPGASWSQQKFCGRLPRS